MGFLRFGAGFVGPGSLGFSELVLNVFLWKFEVGRILGADLGVLGLDLAEMGSLEEGFGMRKPKHPLLPASAEAEMELRSFNGFLLGLCCCCFFFDANDDDDGGGGGSCELFFISSLTGLFMVELCRFQIHEIRWGSSS